MLVVAGIAFFVVGVIVVALLGRDNKSSAATGSGTVDVLVAKEDVPAGTNGDDVTSKVEVTRVSASDRQPDALSTPSQLSNAVTTLKFSKGEQIRQGGLRQRSSVSQVPVPAGKEEVAVSIPNQAAGGACYIAPGDMVNLYEVWPSGSLTSPATNGPHSQLLLTKVQVLDISCQAAPLGTQPSSAAAASSSSVVTRSGSTGSVTALLAVDSIDAEKVIFGSTAEDAFLYMTRVDSSAPPSGDTSGRGADNIFDEQPQVANARDH